MSEEKSIRERRKTRFADKTLGTNRVSEDPERMKEWDRMGMAQRVETNHLPGETFTKTKEFRHGQPWLRLPQILDVTLPSGVGRVQTLRKGEWNIWI